MKTIEDIRREWVERLIARYGSLAELNTALGRKRADAMLSQIRNASNTSNQKKPKSMGSEQARSIEATLGLESGTLDHDANELGYSVAGCSPAQRLFLQQAVQALSAREVPDHVLATMLYVLQNGAQKRTLFD